MIQNNLKRKVKNQKSMNKTKELTMIDKLEIYKKYE